MNRRNFLSLLKPTCLASTDDVFRMAKDRGFTIRTNKGRSEQRIYAFRPGSTPTAPLLVCHADTVVNGGTGPHGFSFNKRSDTVTSIALDDRLGVTCLFYGLAYRTPLAECAMLICDDEEIGYSSAQVFSEKIKPNFLVELDRRGTDVVCYDYDTPLLRSLLTFSGFKIGSGSFSDICYLQSLGVAGFNVGVGYHREHSVECHAKLGDTQAQLERLYKFLGKFGDVRLDHIDCFSSSKSSHFGSGWMANSNDDRCDICNKKVIPKSTNCIMESGILYCSRCYTDYGIADPDNLRADDYPQF